MKQPFLLTGLLLGSTLASAQTTELPGFFKFGPLAKVIKIVTVPDCPQSYTPPAGSGTAITHTTKLKSGGAAITVESAITGHGSPVTIKADKQLRINWYPGAEGKANLYLDDNDKTVLYVNYGLNRIYKVPANRQIEEYEIAYDCAGTPTIAAKPATRRILAAETALSGEKVPVLSPETASNWFKNSNRIAVYNQANTGIEYYLVDKYDRTGTYVLELQNREYIAYNHQSFVLGALAIPFKYRFGYTKGNTTVKDDIIAGFNIGVFGGYKITRSSIINKKNTYVLRNHTSLRVGPFINLSSATLDSVTTTAGDKPFLGADKQNIAVLSPGAGVMMDVRGVQIGVYGGWDIGIGAPARSWNYQGRFWLGFGLGYKLTDLFAQKD
ncbi:MAG TPA: hypothetical protein VL092_06265 [Chitinophagaceae bacterium]|nr:hypothetical protein [Chitinophagaceae bacterium]